LQDNIFLNVKFNLYDLCCLSWLFAAGRGTSRHLMSPLWRLVLSWWLGARGASAFVQAVEEVAVPELARPSAAGQAAQLAAARLELALRQAEV
jgi:hypothetical protein